MSSLKEQVNKTAMLLNDIKVALEDQGVDTSNMTPKDYANAIRGVVNNITIDNISLIPVLIFKYSENRPDRPDGGSWNPETGETLVPEGWYTDIGLDYNASNKSLTLWMSNAVFSSNGDLYKKWSTPIRISGRDGQDGKQGPEGLPGTVAGVTQFFNYPIFYRGTSDQPDTPWAEYDPIENELQIQNGWTETIERTDNAGVVYWQSYVKYNTANMPPATCTTPIRMTAESSAVTGNIRYYQLSTSRSTPAKGTSSWKKWTEDVDIAPTKTQPYLFCYDETIYGESRRTTSPVYLMATYTLGLLDIDIAYAVGQENTVKKRDGESDSEYNERFGKFWFTDSVEAISADKNKEKHPDDENFNYYPGLTERTTYLWCRETFEYNDHVEQFYRVISYYKAAEKAPVLYSAGVYSDLVYYTRNDEQCPYVFYPTGLYLDESENVITKTEDGKDVPVTDNDSPTDGKKYQYFFLKNSYENNEVFDSFYEAYLNKKWKKIDSFEAIYSDIGIFKSALVGKFVFDDKYMFSMFGKGFIDNNSSGTIKMEYTNFTDTKGKIWDDSEGKWKTREGVATAIDAAVHGAEADKKFIPGTLINAVTGESWFANGNTRFYYDGEGDLAGGAIAWRYDNDESEKPTLYIDGDVKIGTRANDHVYDTSVAISDAKSFNEVVSEQDTIKKMISQVQDQIDGVVENYFEEGAPTTKNKPVTDWIAASDDDDYELINHVGDTYTNIEEYVGDTTPDAGKSWRWCWCQDDSITDKIKVIDKEGVERYLHWHPIADSDAVKALLKAKNAQDTADGKRRNFVAIPKPPYEEGDLWSDSTTGDLKVCVKAKEDGKNYDASDWENATKYTDGANVQNLLANSAEAIVPAKEGDNYNYLIFPLPIGVSTGDTFTFKAEKADALIGDFTQFTLRLMNTACTEDYSAYNTMVDIGENVTVTLTVTRQGLTNAHAVLLIYAGLIDNTASKSLRVAHFSLTKGTAAMPMWQDYQGDNGLKNLIDENSDEVVELISESANGHGDFATLTVNGGEVYTFMAEAAEITRGNDTGFNIGFYDETLKKWVNKGDTVLYVEKGNYVWRTFEVERQVIVGEESKDIINTEVKFKIYAGQASQTAGQTLKLTRASLVKGTRPMMVWKGPDDITYLKNTFGTVTDVDGVSLSKAVAVKDKNNKIVTIIDGSCSYTKIGEIAIAAGVDTSASNISEGIHNAKLKIFNSGSLTIGETLDNSEDNNFPIYLKCDGSGHLANGNISWNNSGKLTVAAGTFKGTLSGATGDFSGKITASSGSIGSWNINTKEIFYKDSVNYSPSSSTSATASDRCLRINTSYIRCKIEKSPESNSCTYYSLEPDRLFIGYNPEATSGNSIDGTTVAGGNPSIYVRERNGWWGSSTKNKVAPIYVNAKNKNGVSIECNGGIVCDNINGHMPLIWGGNISSKCYLDSYSIGSELLFLVNNGASFQRGTYSHGTYSATQFVFVRITEKNKYTYSNLKV